MYASTRASRVPIGALPEMWNDVRRPHHRIAGLAAERRGERRKIGERPVVAPTLRRVRIDDGTCAHRLGPVVRAPALRVGNEESLLGREAVDQLFWPAVSLERAL